MNFLRVNMGSLTCRYEKNNDYIGLAGRALSSKFIPTEVPPNSYPLGKENKLIFTPGLKGLIAREQSKISSSQ